MTEYKIKIYYQTGNSLNTYDEEEYLDLSYNLDAAKRNLKNIKEHYSFYNEINNPKIRQEKSIQEILNEVKDKEWFVNENKFNDNFHSINCMKLFLDDDKSFKIHCFWCGYFEKLYSVEIVDDNLRIEF